MQTTCAARHVAANSTRMSREGGGPARRPSFAPPRRQPTQRTFPEPEAAATASPGSQELSLRRSVAFFDSPDNVKDFPTLAAMLEEVQQNIALRQDTISLLTGEVTRLQGQMDAGKAVLQPAAAVRAPSPAPTPRTMAPPPPPPPLPAAAPAAALPAPRSASPAPAAATGLPSPFSDNAAANVGVYGLGVAAAVVMGGVVAPVVEEAVGLGGPAYFDLISSAGLPTQLAEVDPIVASNTGGAVGILTAQLFGQKRRQ